MAQIADLYPHDNWETDKDGVHNGHQPIYEKVVGEHFSASYSRKKPWNTLLQAARSLVILQQQQRDCNCSPSPSRIVDVFSAP